MNKGIVMEITSKSIVVMRRDGKFDKLPRRNRSCEVGEEIVYAETGMQWASPSIAGRSAIVAAVVFCLVLFASYTGKIGGGSEVVAYVSLDINPSVEMGIDDNEQVLELRGLNDDGAELVKTLDYKGKTLETVTASLLDQAEKKSLSKGEADIVIASSVVREKTSVNDEQLAQKLRQQVTDHIKQAHPAQASAYQVEAFAAPQEVREEAAKSGVSMGKYSVYLNAKSNGLEVTLDDLKKESIHQIIKDNPDNKSAFIQPDKIPTKDAIKKLVEEEKSGELDKRLENKKKQQTAKDNEKNDDKAVPDNKNDSKKSTTNSINANNANKNNDKNNQNDNSKEDKKTNTPQTTSKSTPSTQTGSKSGVPNPAASRQADTQKDDIRDDNKKEEVKKKDDKLNDDKSDDKNEDKKNGDLKKNGGGNENVKPDPSNRTVDDSPRTDTSKKQQDDSKKEENPKKNDGAKKDPSQSYGNRIKDDSDTNEENKKGTDNKKDSDNKKDIGKQDLDTKRDSAGKLNGD